MDGEPQDLGIVESELEEGSLAQRVSDSSYAMLQARFNSMSHDAERGHYSRRGLKIFKGEARKISRLGDDLVDGLFMPFDQTGNTSIEFTSRKIVFVGDDGKRRFLSQYNVVGRDPMLEGFYDQHPILEVVYLAPMARKTYREETYTERERVGTTLGGFGWGKYQNVEKTKKIPEGVETVPFNKVVKGRGVPDTDENAYLFHYACNPNGLRELDLVSGKSATEEARWFNSSNLWNLSLILPESVAREVDAALRENPLYAREIYRQVIADEFPNNIKEATPPYDYISEKGLQMYMALDTDVPVGPDMPKYHVIDPKNIVDLRTGQYIE